jgi:hypothetical protein
MTSPSRNPDAPPPLLLAFLVAAVALWLTYVLIPLYT